MAWNRAGLVLEQVELLASLCHRGPDPTAASLAASREQVATLTQK